jgi:hypothetical protein
MAARKNNRFVPTLEALEAREVASANPISPPAALADHAIVGQFQTGAPVMHDIAAPQALAPGATAASSAAANHADPLISSHRTYVGLNDLRKGDILLNTTNATLSNWIKDVTNSNYNHAAIYVGNGKVVEAVGSGVQEVSLQKYLSDKDIVRVMVLRNGNLSTGQQDAIANFARSKVGAKYNVGGLAGAAVNFKPHNWLAFDRKDYFCSQLVAAAHSSAQAPLDLSLEQTPGNLADMVNRIDVRAIAYPKLTVLGALYDAGYHRSVSEGRECVNLDLTAGEQRYLVDALSARLNRDGGNYSVQLNRLTVDSARTVLAHFTVTRPGMGNFEVYYRIKGGDTSANIEIVASRPSPEFVRTESHIGAAVERVMMSARGQLHHKYFGSQGTLAVAPQGAGRLDAGDDTLAQTGTQATVSGDARHFAAVDAVFADATGFSRPVRAA